MKHTYESLAELLARIGSNPLDIPEDVRKARLYLLQNTEKLLRNFHAMKWATLSRVEDTLQERGVGARTSDLLISDKVDKMVRALSDQVGTANDPDTERGLRRSREALRSAQLSLELIERVEHTLEHIKSFPSMGDVYFSVLQATYFSDTPANSEDIIKELSMSKTVYFARKREAVKLFSTLLWPISNPHLSLYAQILSLEEWSET